MKDRGYRGRLAPSPTGSLHIGHAFTFLQAHRRAMQAGGKLIYRDEDLDSKRCKPEFSKAAMRDLQELGLSWQEGPDKGGLFGPYRQRERLPIYKKYFYKLLMGGHIYPCPYSRRQIQRRRGNVRPANEAKAKRGEQKALCRDSLENEKEKQENFFVVLEALFPVELRPAPKLRQAFLEEIKNMQESARSAWEGNLNRIVQKHFSGAGGFRSNPPKVWDWQRMNWRFFVREGCGASFADGRLGEVSFAGQRDFGDFLIWRKEGVPSYELAVVVDDASMQITEVVRGKDLLLSTARQLLIYKALGWTAPAFYHTPLVCDRSGRKLSKRDGDGNLRAWLDERGPKALQEYLQVCHKE